MDKMGYARGLVKYSTQNGVEQNWTSQQIVRHVARPRVLLYSAILLAIVLAMGISLVLRTPFKVDVVRDRGTLARIVSDYIAGMTDRFALQCHEKFVGGVDAAAMRSVPAG